ncbi:MULTISPECIES: winged helix-turn-helix transcriptional regulator [Bradyrhizobium]|uniref:winged helix-turn-helix transcriptional regulator n=1 Tax=Bradyrhizobium brasilense TaxID=1419277 RepID=UPI000975B297|nr:helix-turn-helix domain-containing protein [Bradyrhizobium brasilense]OMI06341.1 MarR family transcriptional regulator [Bradyrhizobium brasilense]
MRSKGFEGMACSVASVMGAIGDRWGVLIMRDLLLGLKRFDDLKKSTEITNATLSDRLKSLERNGLIERRKYDARRERYEYVPTTKGRDLALVIQAMVQIGDKWNLEELEGPPLRFVDGTSGRGLKLAYVDAETGKPVKEPRMKAEAGRGADILMQWRLAQAQGR